MSPSGAATLTTLSVAHCLTMRPVTFPSFCFITFLTFYHSMCFTYVCPVLCLPHWSTSSKRVGLLVLLVDILQALAQYMHKAGIPKIFLKM